MPNNVNNAYDRTLYSAINEICLKLNYLHQMRNAEQKAFIVEGFTDEEFINRVKKSNIFVFSIGDYINARAEMLNNSNAKVAILDIFQRLQAPSFFNFPPGCGQWEIYGLIDRDYGDDTQNCLRPRLFITDTHDIETLILFTDSEAVNRIKKFRVSTDAYRNVLHLAYQLACYRHALYKMENKKIDLKDLSSSDGTINYSAFVDNDTINPTKLLKMLYLKRDNQMPKKALNRLVQSIQNDRKIKKNFDKNGLWRMKKESFSTDQVEDFWQFVRGHDILSAICFYDLSAKAAYRDTGGYKINREFEKDLVAVYDISLFSRTELFNKMKEADLLESC